MSFQVTAEAYAQFMGRFSDPLAEVFADQVGVRAGQRALDVGCGPGALTAELVGRLGAAAVSAVDPSPSFLAAVSTRCPGVDIQLGRAEELPYGADTFDATLAQLVVHFMADPVAGLVEMARVTRAGGVVGACVWDHSPGGRGPLTRFWRAVADLDPAARGEAHLAGARQGHLAALFRAAGFDELTDTLLTARVTFATVQQWWEPFTLGVGPAGVYVASLDDRARTRLRDHCADLLPPAPFAVEASAWCVVARRE